MESDIGEKDGTVSTPDVPEEKKDVKYWQDQISRCGQELDKFHERGKKVVQRYLDVRDAYEDYDRRVNIFWANVGILKAALYANPPAPMVSRQFEDPNDDVARVAAEIMERMLSFGIEQPRSDMDSAFMYAVEDRLVPGLGQIWLRYVPTIEKATVPGTTIEYEQLVDETVKTDYVYWRDFLWSPARVWEEVTWVGRAVEMTRKQTTARFGEAVAKKLNYKETNNKNVSDGGEPVYYAKRVARVYEIWDKTEKEVLFVAKECDKFLDKKADPLKIRGFFPCPRPLLATNTTSNLTPRPDYYMVKDQYKELDKVNTRVNYLVDACKAVGVYDKNNDGIQTMMQNGVENQLIPVDNWAMFAERGGLQGQIDWLPIEQVAAVHEKLRVARADLIAQLYELTGISDIMRGVSAPRETATAQQLKAQYSSARLQYLQEEVARFCQEGMRIKGDIIARHFKPKTLFKKSNIQHTHDMQYAEQAIQLLKSEWEALYRLEIEADKLAIPDYNSERASRIEYATSVGQMLGQSQKVLEAAPFLAPFILQTLQWVAAGFKNGRQMESVLDNTIQQVMEQLQQPRPDPEAEKAKQEAQVKGAQAQQEGQIKGAQAQQEGQIKGVQAQQDMAISRVKALSDIQVQQKKARNEMAISLAKEQAQQGNNPTANENSR